MSTAVAKHQPTTPPAPIRALAPTNIDELVTLANIYYHAGVGPKNCNRPEGVAAIIAAGMEVGLKPGQSLSSLYMVNGKIVMYGDAPLALVRGSGLLESIRETLEGDGDNRTGVCIAKRKGDAHETTRRFSLGEARKAGLLLKGGKPGPWDVYTDRMLMLRARGWLIRDLFGDVLAGFQIAEEVEDYAAVPQVAIQPTPVVTATAPAIVDATPKAQMVDEGQTYKIKQNLPDWFACQGVDPKADPKKAGAIWADYLRKRFNVSSAKDLTASQADELIETMIDTAHKQNETAAGMFGVEQVALPKTEEAIQPGEEAAGE